MKTPNYSFYSKDELIEIITDLENTLSYNQDTIQMLKDENKVLKKEFYQLHEKIIEIEKFREKIQCILSKKTTSSDEKLSTIKMVML